MGKTVTVEVDTNGQETVPQHAETVPQHADRVATAAASSRLGVLRRFVQHLLHRRRDGVFRLHRLAQALLLLVEAARQLIEKEHR